MQTLLYRGDALPHIVVQSRPVLTTSTIFHRHTSFIYIVFPNLCNYLKNVYKKNSSFPFCLSLLFHFLIWYKCFPFCEYSALSNLENTYFFRRKYFLLRERADGQGTLALRLQFELLLPSWLCFSCLLFQRQDFLFTIVFFVILLYDTFSCEKSPENNAIFIGKRKPWESLNILTN